MYEYFLLFSKIDENKSFFTISGHHFLAQYNNNNT